MGRSTAGRGQHGGHAAGAGFDQPGGVGGRAAGAGTLALLRYCLAQPGLHGGRCMAQMHVAAVACMCCRRQTARVADASPPACLPARTRRNLPLSCRAPPLATCLWSCRRRLACCGTGSCTRRPPSRCVAVCDQTVWSGDETHGQCALHVAFSIDAQQTNNVAPQCLPTLWPGCCNGVAADGGRRRAAGRRCSLRAGTLLLCLLAQGDWNQPCTPRSSLLLMISFSLLRCTCFRQPGFFRLPVLLAPQHIKLQGQHE